MNAVANLAVALFASVAAAAEPVFTSAFVARWNLSHGEYLVDVGQYMEAIEAFDTAIEMADTSEVRGEAQLQKASVLALFLDNADDAVRVYDDLIRRDPQSSAAEAALLRAGMALFDGGQYGRAAAYFERYLQRYPEGASRGSAEFLLGQSRTHAAATPTPFPTPTAPPPNPPPATPGATAPPQRPPPSTVRPTAGAALRTTSASAVEVRVRVLKGQSRIRVEADGPLSITPALASGRAVEFAARDGKVVADSGDGVREVAVRADGPLTIRAGRTTRHYRGGLTLRADGNSLLVLNRVGMEEYLYGVVTKESVPSWPIEALKAQAIASRTYALFQVQHRRDRAYDMVDDEGSLVYGGSEGESARGRRAVDETRGTVLVYGGRPIYAMFTANTGWHTGDPKFIFDQPLPYLNAVPDPYSPGEQLGRWKRDYSAAEVQRALASIGVRLGTIRAIEPRVSCPSGRIVRVAIEDDQGVHVMRTRPTLGRALKLPEILLDIRHEGDRFVFAGGGFGHGVGMSQWGAKNMAGKGFAAQDILAFYYRGAEPATTAP